MTTTQDIIAKNRIDVNDDITFRTHADVLRLFGRDAKILRDPLIKHPHESRVSIWFPKFYDDDNNDWENTFGSQEENVFERRKYDNEDYLRDLFESPDLHTRILFAKTSPSGKVVYKFKGVYEFDPDLSHKAKKAAYRRIATTAKVYSAK